MGFLSFLFGKPNTTVLIEDEVFGSLKQKIFGEHDSECIFYNYALTFAPTGRKIECEIKCPAGVRLDRPTAAQRAFYKHIERRYDQLTEAITVILKAELKDWNPPFRFQNFEEEFQLVYLLIPAAESGPMYWEWTFELVRDTMYSFSVEMRGDEPQPGISVSC